METSAHLTRRMRVIQVVLRALKPEQFSHSSWGGLLDTTVGYAWYTMREQADADTHSLLLLALNRRAALLEQSIKVATAAKVGPAGAAGAGVATRNSQGSSPGVVGRWRPDRCAHLYATYDPEALNPAQVWLPRCITYFKLYA